MLQPISEPTLLKMKNIFLLLKTYTKVYTLDDMPRSHVYAVTASSCMLLQSWKTATRRFLYTPQS